MIQAVRKLLGKVLFWSVQKIHRLIRESLEKLIENPQLCAELGRAARKRVEEYFGWDSISGKHISLYSQLTCFAPKLQMLIPLLTVLLM